MTPVKRISTVLVLGITLLATGCAKVPMAPEKDAAAAKQFTPPPEGKAGLYIFRDSYFGAALKKDIYVDKKCLGESAPNVFFYTSVEGDKEHVISTESEFSPNDTKLNTQSGKNYFLRQYIKMGVLVGGADLELVSEEEGKKAVSQLDMAKSGTCNK